MEPTTHLARVSSHDGDAGHPPGAQLLPHDGGEDTATNFHHTGLTNRERHSHSPGRKTGKFTDEKPGSGLMSNNFPGKQSRVVLATTFKRALAACSWRHGLSQPNDCGKGRLGERKERERSTARLNCS